MENVRLERTPDELLILLREIHERLRKKSRRDFVLSSNGRRPKQRLDSTITNSAAALERYLQIECWLRIQEANARWQRNKEMILVVAAVFVILNTCVASTFLITLKSVTPSERQLAFFVLGQIITILIGVLVGKNIEWKK